MDKNDNNYILPLKLSQSLAKRNIIVNFYYHIATEHINISINHNCKPCSAAVRIDFEDFAKSVTRLGKILSANQIPNDIISDIKNNIYDKFQLIWDKHTNKNRKDNDTITIDQVRKISNTPKKIVDGQNNSDGEKYEEIVQQLRAENPELSFEEWSGLLLEKRMKFNDKVTEYYSDMLLLAEFELSIKTILNVQDITLPFMGIVFAVPSSLKSQFFKLLRNLGYSYYTDKFTAKSFVSHSANVSKDKLQEIDMLPAIKDKILLTPDLSALFTGKDDDIREQFGLITRLLDGEGLETNSGVHGKRGYYGNYMFTWLGAAVDIPYKIYKFLSTIGFKIYFLRLPRTEVTEDDLVEQLTSKKKFGEKMVEIREALIDYLTWFDICPIDIGECRNIKIEWDDDKDDRDAIRIIAKLALLLAHIRGHVEVFSSSNNDDLIPIGNINTSQNTSNTYCEGFSHRLPTIEKPHRANQQLYNLARGHALSYGRNYITKEDIFLVIKVVLSTCSIERVLVLDLLISHKGTLTTSQITSAMRISNNTAKRTMTEFKGLELVTMEQTGSTSNCEYKITLNPKFDWLLSKEFASLRDGFKPTDYKEYLSKRKSAISKITLVQAEKQQKNIQIEEDKGHDNGEEPSCENQPNNSCSEENKIFYNNNDSHKGKNTDSKLEQENHEYRLKFGTDIKSQSYLISKEKLDSLTDNYVER